MDLETIDPAVFNSGLHGISLNLLVQNLRDQARFLAQVSKCRGIVSRLILRLRNIKVTYCNGTATARIIFTLCWHLCLKTGRAVRAVRSALSPRSRHFRQPNRERWRDGSAGANGSTARLTRALYSMSQWLSLGAQHAPHGGAAIALTRRASSACCATRPRLKSRQSLQTQKYPMTRRHPPAVCHHTDIKSRAFGGMSVGARQNNSFKTNRFGLIQTLGKITPVMGFHSPINATTNIAGRFRQGAQASSAITSDRMICISGSHQAWN